MAQKIIIPDGQSFRFVLRNYYSQPSGSEITSEQAIDKRQYFNTLFRHEEEWNRTFTADLFGNLYADNRKKYVQQFRNNGEQIYLQVLSDITTILQLNSQITITTHKPDGTLISTITDYESGLNINNINFRTSYFGTSGVDINGYQGIYFTGEVEVLNSYSDEVINFFGNIPDEISVGDTLSIDGTTAYVTAIQYIDSLNVLAIKTDISYASETFTNFYHFQGLTEYNSYNFRFLTSVFPQNQCFFMRFSVYADDDKDKLTPLYFIESELYEFKIDLPNRVAFEWSDILKKICLLEYSESETETRGNHKLFLPCEFYTISFGLDESEIFVNEQGTGVLLSAKYQRKYTCVFVEPLPRYIFETLKIMSMHSSVWVNGKRFVIDPKTIEATKTEGGMLFTGSFEMVEYELTGINDTTGYDWYNLTENDNVLKIDSTYDLIIDEIGNKLKINP
jgi:hypothetical protein